MYCTSGPYSPPSQDLPALRLTNTSPRKLNRSSQFTTIHQSILSVRMDQPLTSRTNRLRVYNDILRLSLEEEGSMGISQIEGLATKTLELEQVQSTIKVIEEHFVEATRTKQFDSVLSKALSTLGYIFTGLWQGKNDPDELAKCCNADLVKHLILLLETCELEHQLLVLVVISNQLLPQFFSPHIEFVLGFIDKLLATVTSNNNNVDLIVQQCIATLLNILNQSRPLYRQHIGVRLTYRLLHFLFSKVSALSVQSANVSGTNALTSDSLQLLRDAINLLHATPISILKFFVVSTLKEYDTLEQAIKSLAPKLKEREDLLHILTELWCLYMHIMSALLAHASADTYDDGSDEMNSNGPSISLTHQDIDKARKQVNATGIYHYLEQRYCLYDHAHCDKQSSERQSTMSYAECKVCMHDLIAPPSSVGKLMGAVQTIMSVSREHASRCYAQLCRYFAQDQTWYTPHYVWKLLLRCFHHLLFTTPPALSSPSIGAPTNLSSKMATLKSAEDVAKGIREVGDGLVCLIACTPLSFQEEVLRIEVSVKATKGISSDSGQTMKVSLQVLLDLLAAEAEAKTRSAGDRSSSSPPAKRRRLDELGEIDNGGCSDDESVKDGLRFKDNEAIAYEQCIVYSRCVASLLKAHVRHYKIGIVQAGKGCITLFSYVRGFRKAEVLDNAVDATGYDARSIYDVYMPVLLQRILPFFVKGGFQRKEEGDLIAELYRNLVLLCIRKLFAKLLHSNASHTSSDMFASSQVLSPLLLSHPASNSSCQPNHLPQPVSQTQAYHIYHFTQFPNAQQPTQSITQSPVRPDGDGDQVVLSRVHPLASAALIRVIGDSLQILIDIGRNCELSMSKVEHHNIMVCVLEAVWWVLHRLSSFATSLSSTSSLSPLIKDFMQVYGVSRLTAPANMAGLVTILTLGVFGQLTDAGKVSPISEAIICSMNSLTESGSLSHVISILYQFFFISYSQPASGQLSRLDAIFVYDSSSPVCKGLPLLQVFVYFIKAVQVKLANLTAPNASESLSVDVLLNLRSALRSILLLPCYLINMSDVESRLSVTELLFENDRFLAAYQYLSTVWFTLESRSLDFSNLPDDEDLFTLYPLSAIHISALTASCVPAQTDGMHAFLAGLRSLQGQFYRCFEMFAASATHSHFSPPDVGKNAVYVLAHRMNQFVSCQGLVGLVHHCRAVLEINGNDEKDFQALSTLYDQVNSTSDGKLCIVMLTGETEARNLSLTSCARIVLVFAALRVQHHDLFRKVIDELIDAHGHNDDGVQSLVALLGIVKAEFCLIVSGTDVVGVVTAIETAARESRMLSKQREAELMEQQRNGGVEVPKDASPGDASCLLPSNNDSVAVALEFGADESGDAAVGGGDEIDLMVEDDTVHSGLRDECPSPTTPKDNIPESFVENNHNTAQQEAEESSPTVVPAQPSDSVVLDRSRTEREVAETLVSRFVANGSALEDDNISVESALHDLNTSIQEFSNSKAAENYKPSECVGKLVAALQGAQRLSFLLSQELDKVIPSANK